MAPGREPVAFAVLPDCRYGAGTDIIYDSLMTRWFYLIWCCSAASFVVLESCAPVRRTDSKTKIIQEVEAAGSGPVENASVRSLYTWFEKHTHLANQLNKQCDQVKKTAPPTWGDSTEGRVCEAASEIAVRYYEP